MTQLLSLKEIFKTLHQESNYKQWTKIRIAKITLGNSVIRVFASGTKEQLLTFLSNLKIEDVVHLNTQAEFDAWHLKKVNSIYSCINTTENLDRLGEEGLKWGHATKVFNIFIGLLIFYSPYFKAPEQLERVKHFLHVPLDKKVFDALRLCCVANVPKSIKSLKKKSYYSLQDTIRQEALSFSLPPLYFDEYAWSFDKED